MSWESGRDKVLEEGEGSAEGECGRSGKGDEMR